MWSIFDRNNIEAMKSKHAERESIVIDSYKKQ